MTVAADEHGSPCNLFRVVRFDHSDYVETTERLETLLPCEIRALLPNPTSGAAAALLARSVHH
jgi:hypothetical protein